VWACGSADTCRSTMRDHERPSCNRTPQDCRAPPSFVDLAGNCFNLALESSINSTHGVNFMSKDRHIIITESDFALLHRLADHPRLAAELNNAVVVDSHRVPPNVVTMNSRVQFEDESTGERRNVTIVFPQRADASKGLISVLAPVGTALLGLAEGQSIVWPFPDGEMRCLRVLKIIYQPETDEAPGERRNTTT
jgi:regulator of nucleoside diphosphate kinase